MHNTVLLIALLACLLIPSWLYAKDTLPNLILAKHFSGDIQHQGYWLSEKLDGVRCYWNGRKLLTRNGNEIHAPPWFTAQLPRHALDGELWMARGAFQMLTSVVLDKQPHEKLWEQIQFFVFDLPHSNARFEERQILLSSLVEQTNISHLKYVEQTKVFSTEEIQEKLDDLVSMGAEGVMLRAPNSPYESGRSDYLLKLKPRHDAEARVVAYQAGRGQFEDMLGAIWVETKDGTLFKIGTGFSHEERKNPPPIGSEITFSYQGLTDNGVPRFASYERIRQAE